MKACAPAMENPLNRRPRRRGKPTTELTSPGKYPGEEPEIYCTVAPPDLENPNLQLVYDLVSPYLEKPTMKTKEPLPVKKPTEPPPPPSDPEMQISPLGYTYSMEPDRCGLIVPYLEKFDFEDEEHIDASHFYDSDDEFDCKKDPNAFETTKRFLRQVRESRGYDVDCTPPPIIGSPFIPMHWFREFKDEYDDVMNAANFAIGEINSKSGKTYELIDVKKAVWTRTFTMLLTFTAKEADADADASLKTLRAMVYQPLCKSNHLSEWSIQEEPGSVFRTVAQYTPKLLSTH